MRHDPAPSAWPRLMPARVLAVAKTVGANLTRIYRKLSVRSRTGLASNLNRLDAASPSGQGAPFLLTSLAATK